MSAPLPHPPTTPPTPLFALCHLDLLGLPCLPRSVALSWSLPQSLCVVSWPLSDVSCCDPSCVSCRPWLWLSLYWCWLLSVNYVFASQSGVFVGPKRSRSFEPSVGFCNYVNVASVIFASPISIAVGSRCRSGSGLNCWGQFSGPLRVQVAL
jgi:hypothetical protein